MIKTSLIEMAQFESAKQTDNKLRWDCNVQGVPFSLYIPKWRVPEPWPSRIWVRVDLCRNEGDYGANLSLNDVKIDSALRHEPIVVAVTRHEEKTQTIRYRPVGENNSWEVGEPYIPISLTSNKADKLRLVILWDILSRGSF